MGEHFLDKVVAEELFEKRLEILRFLARRSGEEANMPSVREIGEAVGLRSSQTVYHHLRKLQEDGYVRRLPDRSRTLVLTGSGWEVAGRTPLLGRIAAGRGLEAVAVEDEAYSLASEFLFSSSGKRRYLLKVVGQSMIGARIEDGDLLVVEENEGPENGSVVVALLRGGEEVTVKRIYREGDTVRLVPHNGDHREIVVSAEEVRIQGEVLFVVHPPRR